VAEHLDAARRRRDLAEHRGDEPRRAHAGGPDDQRALATGHPQVRLVDQRRAAARVIETNTDQLDPRLIRDHRM